MKKQELEFPLLLKTADAARLLNRTPQTLRKWACLGEGGIIPLRINGRLAWRAQDILRLLEGKRK